MSDRNLIGTASVQPVNLSASWPASLIDRGLSLRPEGMRDRAFVRTLFGHERAGMMASTPWTMAERRRFLDDQFVLQTAHYRNVEPDAKRWVVAHRPTGKGARAIGRLYVEPSGPVWRLCEISLMPEWQGAGVGGAILDWLGSTPAAAGATGIELQGSHPAGAALLGASRG